MTLDQCLFPNVPLDNWQMMQWERIALTGVLSQMRPRLALEVGVYYGGSLTLTSAFAGQVCAIDIDPEVRGRFPVPPNVELVIGDSTSQIPRLLAQFAAAATPLEFVLIDADHSSRGVKRDIELVLQYRPSSTMVVMVHDSGNPDCRAGIRSAEWTANPNVHSVDLDFVPGQIIEHSVVDGRGECWGGLAIAYLEPTVRDGPLEIRESARSSIAAIHKACRN